MRPLRNPVVVRILAAIFAGYMRLVFATLRWSREGQEVADAVAARNGETGLILCFWHARIPIAPPAWPPSPERQPMRALISQSADGEFIAQAVERIGFPAIRGSSKKKSDPAKNKGGEQALREMVQWVRDGGGMAVTPDGPRGPAEVMQLGVGALARMTGAPVLLLGVACEPCLRLGTWDGTILPLPFARAAMVWDGPFAPARKDNDADLVADWGARLTAVTQRAEAILANRP
ncbi:lysophospholipid acyltransferase family protein [Caulobacter sp. NIBR2454]|uniref:lysophospholipid acyltransferase family protein n=1 Tax=Caulobacter sp. NIBR2454 TaxID=3015996 RepID=UPI0022B63796|nr:lysophospholipid acyltransferase family protein [Caulobacter sp. NIBR2454]